MIDRNTSKLKTLVVPSQILNTCKEKMTFLKYDIHHVMFPLKFYFIALLEFPKNQPFKFSTIMAFITIFQSKKHQMKRYTMHINMTRSNEFKILLKHNTVDND